MAFDEELKIISTGCFTQAEISALLCIPQRTIESWFEGNRVPPAYVARMVINELNRIKEERINK